MMPLGAERWDFTYSAVSERNIMSIVMHYCWVFLHIYVGGLSPEC